MSFTNFPNGVTGFGIPLMGGNYSIPNRNGKVLFVDPNGLAPRSSSGRAFRTIQDAIDSMSSDSGSTILVFPGSYEEALEVDSINYLSIIGAMLPGYAKPDIVPTAGLALSVVASQGIVLRHLRFAAPAADTDLILQEGNGFIIEDCVLDGDATQGNAKGLLRLKGNADDDSFTASEGVVRNCLFRGSGGFGLIFDTGDAPGNGVGCTDDVIQGCTFIGNDQPDIVTADTGTGVYSAQRVDIVGNLFATKNKSTVLDFTTSNGGAAGDQSGTVRGNWFANDTVDTTVIKAVGTAFTFPGNFNTVGVVDGSGLD